MFSAILGHFENHLFQSKNWYGYLLGKFTLCSTIWSHCPLIEALRLKYFHIFQLRGREVCAQHRPPVLPHVREGELEHQSGLLPFGREVRRVHLQVEWRGTKRRLPDRLPAVRSPGPICGVAKRRRQWRQRRQQLREVVLQQTEEKRHSQQLQQQQQQQQLAASPQQSGGEQQEEQEPLRDALRCEQVLLPRPQLPRLAVHQRRQEQGDQPQAVRQEEFEKGQIRT